MTTRRDFLTQLGVGTAVVVGAVAVPAVTAPVALVLTKSKRADLPIVQTGDTMTASSWNAVIARINELSEAIR